MKRDFDVMRQVLLDAESSTAAMTFGQKDDGALFYNLKTLINSGYLEATDTSVVGNLRVRVEGLTFKGHEFLDAVRSEKTWAYIKSRLPIDRGEMPFHLVEQFAFHVAAQKVTAVSP